MIHEQIELRHNLKYRIKMVLSILEAKNEIEMVD